MLNRDLKGNIIIQRAKDSKSVEIDGNARFCGHRFLLKTRIYGDKRCLYCGKWFHWKDTDMLVAMQNDNIDRSNPDGTLEPLHCGSDHCQEFHHLRKEFERKRVAMYAEAEERHYLELFKELHQKGLVS